MPHDTRDYSSNKMCYNLLNVTKTQLLYTSVETACSKLQPYLFFVYNYYKIMLTVYDETQSQPLVFVASVGWSLCGV